MSFASTAADGGPWTRQRRRILIRKVKKKTKTFSPEIKEQIIDTLLHASGSDPIPEKLQRLFGWEHFDRVRSDPLEMMNIASNVARTMMGAAQASK